jgi:lipid II isoglutaminyl synthase (glutamine-hydrolysing)
MTTATIRICHLYPRLLSVAGDRGNLLALTQRCAWRGIRCTITEADAGDIPDFTRADLILLHGGQDREMTTAARDLALKASPLRDAIDTGTVVLAVCAGYQLLGHHYTPADGPPLDGIGILDIITQAGPRRFIGHSALECDLGTGPRQLIGFENHSGRTYLGSNAAPLGKVIAGAGNNGQDGTEGARHREIYATYLHGPLLPKNPWFADHLLTRALTRRHPDHDPLTPLPDHTEQQAHTAALHLAKRPSPGLVRAATAASGLRRTRWAPLPAARRTGIQARAVPARAVPASAALTTSTIPTSKENRWTSH